jgi:sulfur-oxidizing protein SoxA
LSPAPARRPPRGWHRAAAAGWLCAATLATAQMPAAGPQAAAAAPARPSEAAPARPALRSGFEDMSPAVQALQRDDAANPALLWLRLGQERFATQCARCHDAGAMRGVAARYPALDAANGRVLTLSARVQQCRERHAGAPPQPPEHEERLALEMAVAHASRGLPIAPPAGTAMDAVREQGRQLFVQRLGQLELSCAQCHDAHAGARLAGSTIPQGHPGGYPAYRLEWQGIGSLQRRLRGCLTGVRAEPFAFDGAELTALEAYLMQRAAGLRIETPAVRP